MTSTACPARGTGRVRFYLDNGADSSVGRHAGRHDALRQPHRDAEVRHDRPGLRGRRGAEDEQRRAPTSRRTPTPAAASSPATSPTSGCTGRASTQRQQLTISFTGTATWNPAGRARRPTRTPTSTSPSARAHLRAVGLHGGRAGGELHAGGAEDPRRTPCATTSTRSSRRPSAGCTAPNGQQLSNRGNSPGASRHASAPVRLQHADSAAPANQCGRVLFSDFHVINANGAGRPDLAGPVHGRPDDAAGEGLRVPDLRPRARASRRPHRDLHPKTCRSSAPVRPAGRRLRRHRSNCGTCTAPQTCGGGGTPGVCGARLHAEDLRAARRQLRPAGDGCGGTLDCGACTAPQTCGGGGAPGVVRRHRLHAEDLRAARRQLRPAGRRLRRHRSSCGTCTAPQTCGGGGVAGVVRRRHACAPKTCAAAASTAARPATAAAARSTAAPAPRPQTCGGGGTPGRVRRQPGACTPKTCAQQRLQLRPGRRRLRRRHRLRLRHLPPDDLRRRRHPGQCGGVRRCTPMTCAARHQLRPGAATAAAASSNCGTCTAPQTCGGGGVPGQLRRRARR